MRWLIVEDALRDRKGHWLEYVSTFVRELRALEDDVVVLCDRKAQGFVMEQTGALPVLPESIWHRMGDGAGALKRYLRVPRHAIATFFAMRKVFRGFNHEKTRKDTKGEKRGARRGELGEKEDLTTYNTDGLGFQKTQQGDAQGACAGASEPDLLTSKLADSPVSESLTRSASAIPCFDPRRSTLDARHTSARDAENSSLTRSASGHASSPATSYPLPVTAPEVPLLDARRSTLDSSPASPDWIFVPTVLVHHLLGWWLLLKTGSVPGDSRVLLFFPNLPIRVGDSGKPFWFGGPTTKLMAWLFEQLRGEVESGKVVLGVETHAMRRALDGLIRMRVVYLPHPVEAAAPQEENAEKRKAEKLKKEGTTESAAHRTTGLQDNGLPGGEEILTTKITNTHERGEVGLCLDKPSGAEAPQALGLRDYGRQDDQETSELARDCEITSLIRSADNPSSSPTTSHSLPDTAPAALALDPGRSSLDTASPATSNSLPATSAKPIVFGCYGVARWEKGSDILQAAIRRVLEEKPEIPVRFAFQWIEDFNDEHGRRVTLDSWVREHPKVEVIERYFDDGEIDLRLSRTDSMMLPYRSPYRLRVSRVVIEAMLNGMPVIATEGTTLHDQASAHGCVLGCEEGSVEGLAKRILEAAANFDKLQRSAKAKIPDVEKSFSVEYFRELLEKSGSI